MGILPFSTQVALYDAARYLQENQEAKARAAIASGRGKMTEAQIAEIDKILKDGPSEESARELQKIKPWIDARNIKGEALKYLIPASAQNLLRDVIKSTDFSSPYSISIALLGSSYLKGEENYPVLQAKFFEALGLNKDDSAAVMIEKLQGDFEKVGSLKIWLLGRALLAAINRGESDLQLKICSVMTELLKRAGNDPCSVWARGYLEMYGGNAQPIEETELLSQKTEEQGQDNVLWAIAMNLQSIKDKQIYDKQLQKLKSFTRTSSVVDALMTIPRKDFRAWAMSLVLLAAARMHDTSLYLEISTRLAQEIDESPSKGDRMLAILIADQARQLLTIDEEPVSLILQTSDPQAYAIMKEKFSQNKRVQADFDDAHYTVTFWHQGEEIRGIMWAEQLNGMVPCDLSLTGPVRGRAFFSLSSKSREKYLMQTENLQARAAQFFKSALPASIPGDSSLTPDRIIPDLLQKYDGLCIGEDHMSICSKRFLIENMAEMKANGVTTLFLEHLLADSSQKWLDEYSHSPSGSPMPPYLKNYLSLLDGCFYTDIRYNYAELVRSAKEAGIRVVAIDTTVSAFPVTTVELIEKRLLAMNFVAKQIMDREKRGK